MLIVHCDIIRCPLKRLILELTRMHFSECQPPAYRESMLHSVFFWAGGKPRPSAGEPGPCAERESGCCTEGVTGILCRDPSVDRQTGLKNNTFLQHR